MKKNNERLEAKFFQAQENLFSNEVLRDLLTGENGLVELEKLRQERTTKSISFLTGSEFKTFQDNMDATQKTAAMQVLADGTFAQTNPVKIISYVQSNRLASEKIPIGVKNSVRLLKSMGMSNTEIAQELRKMQTDMVNFEENEQANVNLRATEARPQLVANVINAMVAGNTEAFETAIKALEKNDAEKAAEMQKEFIEAGRRRTVSDPDVRSNLVNHVSSAELSFDDVATAVADGTLSNKDIEYFQGEANKIENEEFSETAAFMRGLFELPANYTAIKDTDPNFQKAQIFARLRGKLERELTLARQSGQNYDAFAIATELIAEEGGAITDVENKIKIKSARQAVKFINGFADQLEKIGVETFGDDDFEGAMRFLITQKRTEPRERIPALRSKDIKDINGYIDQLNDGIEASQ